ncbi:MAG: APC family permease [Nocardioides sp.]
MTTVTQAQPGLVRRLGLGDAVFIGLGSMVGAGVFAAYAPAARAAGSGLLVGLAVAAVVAYCNATASAQLAASYPRAGGTYLYGREVLGPWWGYLAGWGFMVGKTASCAAMALTFAAYVAPGDALRPVAAAVVVVVALVNCAGITRTALLTRVLVTLVLIALVVAVVVCLRGGSTSHLAGWSSPTHGLYGVLQSAGLLFFAFAGYARIATLGEEVRDPARVIPRAIVIALTCAVAVYAVVALAVLSALGPDATAASSAPVADAVRATSNGWLVAVVRVGGALASGGALLALVAGLGRTGLAMARERDLPGWLDAVHPRFHVPHRAELTVAAVVVALVLTTDLRGAIGFSSFGVLLYYFVANSAAYRQPASARRFPRWLQLVGCAGCLLLVASLPWRSVVVGLAVFAVGLALRALRPPPSVFVDRRLLTVERRPLTVERRVLTLERRLSATDMVGRRR